MALSREITARIKELLEKHPQGLSITDIVRSVKINRNTAGRYLDSLLVSGQVEMRHFGMAKIYTLSERLPVSSVLSISSEYVMQLDGSLRIIYINSPFEELLGITSRDVRGKNIEYTLIPQVLDTAFPRVLSRLKDGLAGAEYRGEIEIPALGRIFSCRIVPIVTTEGQKGVSVILEDITRQKNDEEQLRTSETRYRVLAEASRDLIYVIDREGRIEYVNSFAAAFMGMRAEELTGQMLTALFPEPVRKRQEEQFSEVFRTGVMIRTEGPLSQEEVPRWFDHCLVPLMERDGTVRSVLGISRDITGRKRGEEEIFRSRQMLQLVLDTVPVRVFWKDKNSVFLGCNRALALDAGHQEPAELVGKTDREIASSALADRYIADDREVMETGKPKLNFEEPQIRKDGTTAWLRTSKVPLRDRTGNVIGVLGTYEDITESKRAEAELVRQEQQYHFIVDNSLDVITRHTPTCICTYVSPSVERVLGYTVQESIGISLLALIHPDDICRIQEELHKIIGSDRDEVTSTFRYRHKDGRYLWFETTTNVIRDEKTGAVREFLSVSRNITPRIESEEIARRRDRVLRAFAQASGFLLTERVVDPIPRVLATMGDALDADVAYLYRDRRGASGSQPRLERVCRWTRDASVDPGAHKDGSRLFPISWSDRLASGIWISCSRDRFPPEVLRLTNEMGVRSILIAPVMVGGAYWGFVGASNLHEEYAWADAEIEILMTLAATIGLVLERQEKTPPSPPGAAT